MILPYLQTIRVHARFVLFKVLQPAIQLCENVVQLVGEIRSVTSHPIPTKVFPDRDPRCAENAGRKVDGAVRVDPAVIWSITVVDLDAIPLGPGEKQIGLEKPDVFESPELIDNASKSFAIACLEGVKESRFPGQPRQGDSGNSR